MSDPSPHAPRTVFDEVQTHLSRRLDQLSAERPDLDAALTLQRSILTQEVELLHLLVSGGLPSLTLPPRYVAAKLGRGIPALHGEPVPLPLQVLWLALRDFCERLRSGATEDAATTLQQRFDEHRLDPNVVLSACFGRDQLKIRTLAAHAEVSPDVLWLIAELALAPFAHLLQVQTLTRPVHGEVLEAALRDWDRGFCPACGSWPALIEAAEGHVLRCSFCACGWELHAYRCIYCGNNGESFITAVPDRENIGRRLQFCGECGGYAKVIKTDGPITFPLVAVEDLASMDLDMAAIDRDYVRPALPQIRKQ